MKKILVLFGGLLGLGLLIPRLALAVCPICTVAVAAGVGLCRWLGVDDSISGAWIGGIIVSMVIWFLNWLDKKQFNFKFRDFSISLLLYLIVIIPLYWMQLMTNKLTWGIFAGSVVFLIAVWLNEFLKNKNGGKVFFPFQKVVLPVTLLIILSIVFYFTC
jgi:hypothetical protein